jgi:hypothetical protein
VAASLEPRRSAARSAGLTWGKDRRLGSSKENAARITAAEAGKKRQIVLPVTSRRGCPRYA